MSFQTSHRSSGGTGVRTRPSKRPGLALMRRASALWSSEVPRTAPGKPAGSTRSSRTCAGKRSSDRALSWSECRSIGLPALSTTQRHTAASEESGKRAANACSRSSEELQRSSSKVVAPSPPAQEAFRSPGGAVPEPAQHAATPAVMGAQAAMLRGPVAASPAPRAEEGLARQAPAPRCFELLLKAERRNAPCRRLSGPSAAMSRHDLPLPLRRAGSRSRSSRKPTASSRPAATARCSGDAPPASSARSSACRDSSRERASTSPRCAAQWTAVQPLLSHPVSISSLPRLANSWATP
mmetsp:Transcript_32944/g.102871  ORF Transcript_32944/g.102871 Transcript_32944/m.102871 type:complete len:296 (-) Transcript_32944:388-1275(-)